MSLFRNIALISLWNFREWFSDVRGVFFAILGRKKIWSIFDPFWAPGYFGSSVASIYPFI